MSLTPKDIIARLEPINTLIETIFKQLLIGQTGSLMGIKKRLEDLINTSKANDEIPDLNEASLNEWVHHCNDTILNHLDAAARYYRLSWHCQWPTETTLDFTWVNTQWEKFIFLLTPAINRTESPKKKPKFALIADRDDLTQVKNPTLNFQLQQLKLFLQEAKAIDSKLKADEQTFQKPAVDNPCTNEIVSWLAKYHEETDKAQQVIQAISSRIDAHLADLSDERLILLGRSLCVAIQVLETCNNERKNGASKIEALYPQTNNELELVAIEQSEHRLLVNKLEALLLVFIQINVQKNNVEMQFLTKRLLEFVNALTGALTTGKHPLGDTTTVKQLKKALCHHLDGSTDSTRNPTTPGIEVLLKNLFKSSADEKPSLVDSFLSKLKKEVPESAASLLKERIAQIRYAIKKLDEFPIKDIATCFLIQHDIAQQRNEIDANKVSINAQLGRLQLKITDFLKQIASHAAPIPGQGFNTELPTLAIERSNQLKTLQSNLADLHISFTNDAPLIPPLIEIKSLAQITQLQQSTQTTRDNQNRIQSELQTLENDIQEDDVKTLLRDLSCFYQQEKTAYKTKLDIEIKDTEAALLFEANQQNPTAAMTETLRPHNEFVVTLESQQDSLARIDEDVKRHLTALKAHTTRVKEALLKKIPNLDALETTTKSYTTGKITASLNEIITDLNKKNPFYNDLVNVAKTSITCLNDFKSHIHQLNATKGVGLAIWELNYTRKNRAIYDQINLRNRLIESATEIEKRLKTDCYKKSFDLLSQLQGEYVRIFDKYIDSRRTKKLTLGQITELKQSRDSLLTIPDSINNFLSIY